MNNLPKMISVPKEPLDELESGFLHLGFMVNRVASEIEKGADIQPLVSVLRQELSSALTTLTNWREARWKVEHNTSKEGAVHGIAPSKKEGGTGI